MSEIIRASKKGDVDVVRSLLAADPLLVHFRDAEESTALHYAVWKGHRELVELLLDSGADVNAHNVNDHWGTTPLHAAAHSNHSALVKLLAEKGADLNAVDMSRKSALDHTVFHNATGAAKALKALMGQG
jgi:ankyrin repeat protein